MRLICVTLLALMAALGSPAHAHPDANRDGVVDVLDVQSIVNVTLGLTLPDPQGFGDADGNLTVNVVDLQTVVNLILGVPRPVGVIGRTALPNAMRYHQYRHSLPGVGGTGALAYSYSGSLPNGLTLSSTGVLEGMTTVRGVFPFTVAVVDSLGAVSTRALELEVTAPNLLPQPEHDFFSVAIGATLLIPAPGLLINDTDPDGDPLTVATMTRQGAGTLTMYPDGSIRYVAPQIAVSESFEYWVIDPSNGYGSARVNIAVGNEAPVAVADQYTVAVGGLLTIGGRGVMRNDSDANGNPITVTVESPPASGVLALSLWGPFTFQAPSVPGLITFTYRLTDIHQASSVATVTIAVGNAAPVGYPDAYTVGVGLPLVVAAPGVLFNDTDPEWNGMTAELASPCLHGELALAADGSFEYTSLSGYHGRDAFYYRVRDGYGAHSGLVRAEITVNGVLVPGAPVAEIAVSPNPVRIGEPVTITARVSDAWNDLPMENNVSSVSFDGTPVGLSGTTALSYTGHSGVTTGLYSATVTVTGGVSGVRTLFLTVQDAQSRSKQFRFTVMTYSGSPVHVGPTRTHTTIQQGLQAATAGDAVLIDAGVYMWEGNNGLAMPTNVVVAGFAGAQQTIMDVDGGSHAFVHTGADRSSVIMGLTMRGATGSALMTPGSPTIYQCVLHRNISPSTWGAALQTAAVGADPRVLECAFIENRNGALDQLGLNARGGAISISDGSRMELSDSLFLRNTTLNRQDLLISGGSLGGAIYLIGSGQPSLFERCRFVSNLSQSGGQAYGGAIAIIGLNALDMVNCTFESNRVLALGAAAIPSANAPAQNYGRADGGAIAIGRVSNTYSTAASVRIASCNFDSNQCEGLSYANGGAVSAVHTSTFAMHGCSFTSNSAKSDSWSRGGALSCDNGVTSDIENTRFVNNHSGGDEWTFGGACSHRGHAHGRYFNCEFIGNRTPQHGGAVSADHDCHLVMEQCRFTNNGTTRIHNTRSEGGAISVKLSTAVIEHCEFYDNFATNYHIPQLTTPPSAFYGTNAAGGGAIYHQAYNVTGNAPGGSLLRVANCLFVGNRSGGHCSTIVTHGYNPGTTPVAVRPLAQIENCTFVDNVSVVESTGWLPACASVISGGARTSVKNSIFIGNTCTSVFSEHVQPDTGTSIIADSCYIQANSGLAASAITNPITTAPTFATGPQGTSYLLQNWLGVDGGTGSATQPLLTGLTTNPTEAPDTGTADLGWHYWPASLPRTSRTTITPTYLFQNHVHLINAIDFTHKPTPPMLIAPALP